MKTKNLLLGLLTSLMPFTAGAAKWMDPATVEFIHGGHSVDTFYFKLTGHALPCPQQSLYILRNLKEEFMRSLVIALIVAVCASPAIAQTAIFGSISLIRTGWNADSFAIVTREPIRNPANCPTPDGYISNKSFPGYSTFYAAALTAYAASV